MNQVSDNFAEVVSMIEYRKYNAYRKVNEELISLYWDFGKYVGDKVNNSKNRGLFIDELIKFLKSEYPGLKGFNRIGIYRMKQFYETYKDYEFVSPLVIQISWSNNLVILNKTKTIEEKEFYIKLCIKNNYSKRELIRQIESGYYERYLLSNKQNTNELLKNSELNYPSTRILDTYSLEFLNLPDKYSEKDLRKSIINNLKEFILEIGKSFSFVGEEYKVQIGNQEYYIDLLFYNRELSCLVAFELKLGPFKPEYVSKMDFYLEALDRKEKKNFENPSVGVILCSDKDEKVVEYSMSRSLSPTMVSKYQLNLIDKNLLKQKLIELSNDIN